jgi:hypothetical protein
VKSRKCLSSMLYDNRNISFVVCHLRNSCKKCVFVKTHIRSSALRVCEYYTCAASLDCAPTEDARTKRRRSRANTPCASGACELGKSGRSTTAVDEDEDEVWNADQCQMIKSHEKAYIMVGKN